ncbi:unnamed protein product [Rotaria sp. Silwood2]|nr:unnamed protein product [Rotaria sp. Silwood2]CAF2977737.1 unnamed protein product [Rotaria sp. Silwood2]CAF3139448.1 unnamed protein product [Rotaria sp. Silwood2]CAF3970407.1 unnamed protein product [Rotaria sp. Silwood2]CAF3982872.1 unnamed protein product [Rotaria sp. Silwood2]
MPTTSSKCGHTFCHQCIIEWLNKQNTCPTCRNRMSLQELSPIATRIILNQLDRLLVQCTLCKQKNIQRGNILHHFEQCPNKIVPCLAADIKCMWTGRPNERIEHVRMCPFQQIRPIIDELRTELKAQAQQYDKHIEQLRAELNATRQHMQTQIKEHTEQNRFLLALINNGKPMSDSCSKLEGTRSNSKCSMIKSIEANNPPSCSMCDRILVEPSDISVHHCDSGCICNTCFQKYYSYARDV